VDGIFLLQYAVALKKQLRGTHVIAYFDQSYCHSGHFHRHCEKTDPEEGLFQQCGTYGKNWGLTMKRTEDANAFKKANTEYNKKYTKKTDPHREKQPTPPVSTVLTDLDPETIPNWKNERECASVKGFSSASKSLSALTNWYTRTTLIHKNSYTRIQSAIDLLSKRNTETTRRQLMLLIIGSVIMGGKMIMWISCP
jgi:hypothetical protein